ncbi:MAG: class I SAM-dependent methyltransferase [Magnetococcus sp. DMHC-8]
MSAEPNLTLHYNANLLNLIPVSATRVLDIGCGTGALGNRVKARNPAVVYYGVEIEPAAARIAANHMDHVLCANIETDELPFDKAMFDCMVFGDVLEHLYWPVRALEKLKPHLQPGGHMLCCIPNAQNHQILEALLCGDFQYQAGGLLDRTHIRFFTYANAIKMLLDAALVPELLGFVPDPSGMAGDPAFARFTPERREGILQALAGCLTYLQQDPWRFNRYLSTFQFMFRATPNAAHDQPLPPPFPISFVVPMHNSRVVGDYLLSSPIFQGAHPHQLIVLENQTSAAQAVATGLAQAVHDHVVYVQQDVYLPSRWDAMYCQQVRQAEAGLGRVGLLGIAGATLRDGQAVYSGGLVDRHMTRIHAGPLPARVDTLEDCLFGFRKSDFPGMDPALGYHLHATDLACTCRARGLEVVVVEALCYHNSERGPGEPPEFMASARHLAAKWRDSLPLATPRLLIPAS